MHLQYFYPDGGWGWIICGVSFLVHILTTGLQLSYGLLWFYAVQYLHNTSGIGKSWKKGDIRSNTNPSLMGMCVIMVVAVIFLFSCTFVVLSIFKTPPLRVIKMFVTLFGPEMQMFVNNTCL